ncbi:MFS transporter [Azospirillum picis]|uniref:DHA2 family methylenomycin A resistance protein-like MFS transporter n=1 Tax=Azospirillum picis TaxID=488438 RepID=A0ABU0MDY1_9PROT|nr:MFS transporter [Azospirillum picis]MBP2297335.1 DHA2 family methylenomycin A resistance protein-like MFS transporter [Azospirillum picis]MDQ0531642.1 DHA2 family methylenomycin A resistance protein-like MFS transporter [Azospirillum picis]
MSAPPPPRAAEPCADVRRPTLVLVSAMMGVVLVSLDVSVVNVALEALRQSFDVQIDGLQWILNIYTLVYAVLLLSAGALSDRIGARATFLLGFLFFTLSSAACGLAPSFGILLAARAVQGVGAALLVPSAMALLQHTYPDPRRRARAVGLWAGAGSLALAGGPVLGGALIAHVGWRSIFLINLPFGLIGACLSLRYAPRIGQALKRGADPGGQIVAAMALTGFTGALTQAGALGWSHPLILAGLIAGGVLFAAFLAIEARSPHPMMPLELFRNPGFSTALFVGMVINFVYYGLVFVFSLFFQMVQGKSALATGLAFVPLTALIMVVNVIAGTLIGRFGVRPVMLAGLTVAAIGYVAMLSIQAGSSYAAIAPTFIAAGVGIALTVPSIMTAALSGASPARAGIGAGVLNSARQIGGAIGVALFGSILGAMGPDRFVLGMHISIALTGAALVAALLVALAFIPLDEHRP